MRKTFLISIVSSFLTLFISASVQGSYTYTTLDVRGASSTKAEGIDGSSIVGWHNLPQPRTANKMRQKLVSQSVPGGCEPI